jgi:hypothetical protein
MINNIGKLNEAIFFFKKLAENEPRSNEYGEYVGKKGYNFDEFQYYVDAFLCSVRSITEHLLCDYAKYFNLKYNNPDKLNFKKFKDLAAKSNNAQAQKFISDFERRLISLKNSDENYKFMMELRDTTVHKGPIEYTYAIEPKDFRLKQLDGWNHKYNNKFIFLDDPLLSESAHLLTAVQRCRRFLKAIKSFIYGVHADYPITYSSLPPPPPMMVKKRTA